MGKKNMYRIKNKGKNIITNREEIFEVVDSFYREVYEKEVHSNQDQPLPRSQTRDRKKCLK